MDLVGNNEANSTTNLLDAQASQNYHTKEARRHTNGDEAKIQILLKYYSALNHDILINRKVLHKTSSVFPKIKS